MRKKEDAIKEIRERLYQLQTAITIEARKEQQRLEKRLRALISETLGHIESQIKLAIGEKPFPIRVKQNGDNKSQPE